MKISILISISLLLLLNLFVLSNALGFTRRDGREIDDENDPKEEQPILSLNTYKNQTELEELPNDIYIAQALSYIITGSYSGNSTLDDSFDNNTLDALLDLGLSFAASVLADEILYEPEIYNG